MAMENIFTQVKSMNLNYCSVQIKPFVNFMPKFIYLTYKTALNKNLIRISNNKN